MAQAMPQAVAGEADDVEVMFVSTSPLFLTSFAISMLGGFAAIAMSLKTGVCRVVRPGWGRDTVMALLLCWAAAGATLLGRAQKNGEDGEESSQTKPNLMDSLSQNNV